MNTIKTIEITQTTERLTELESLMNLIDIQLTNTSSSLNSLHQNIQSQNQAILKLLN